MLFTCFAIISINSIQGQDVAQNSFKQYIKRFNKSYSGTEYLRRLSLFKDRLNLVLKSQTDYATGKSPILLQINEFSDWVCIFAKIKFC